MDKDRILANIFIFLLLLGLWIVIHECGHAVACYLLNDAEFVEFGFTDGNPVTRCCIYSIEAYRIVAISGHIAVLLYALPFLILGYKFKKEIIYVSGICISGGEFFYMAGSPLIEYGDMFKFLRSFGADLVLCSIIMIIIFVMIEIIIFYKYKQLVDYKCLRIHGKK